MDGNGTDPSPDPVVVRDGHRWSRVIAAGAAVVTLAVVTFGITYALRGDDAVSSAQSPEPTVPATYVTPGPNSTPDTSESQWHVPYLNQERDAEKFNGTINGITIAAEPFEVDPYTICPAGLAPATSTQALDALVSGPMAIPLKSLPNGIAPLGGPEVWLCGMNVVDASWAMEVKAGTAFVDSAGSGLTITKSKSTTRVYASASKTRWSDGVVNGHPAVFMSPIIEADGHPLGGCEAIVLDSGDAVITVIRATAGSAAFCAQIANEATK